jgi:hypothetical protein
MQVKGELLGHVAIPFPVLREVVADTHVGVVIHLQQRVDGLVEEIGPFVGQPAVVEVHDQQQSHHQRTVHEGFSLSAQPRAALRLQSLNPLQQIIRPFGP